MTTSVLFATSHRDALPIGRPKLSQDVVPSGAYQYLQVPDCDRQGDNGEGVVLVVVTSDAAVLLDIVKQSTSGSDTKAVALRPPAGGVRSYTCYAKVGQRLAFKTLA